MSQKASDEKEEEAKVGATDTTVVYDGKTSEEEAKADTREDQDEDDDNEDEDEDDDRSTISVVEAITSSQSSVEVESLSVSQVHSETNLQQQQPERELSKNPAKISESKTQKSVASIITPNTKPTRQLVLTRSSMQHQQYQQDAKQQLNKHRHSFQSPHLLNRRYSHRSQRHSIFQASSASRSSTSQFDKQSNTPPSSANLSRHHQQAVRSASTSLQPSSPLASSSSTSNFSSSPLNSSISRSPISSASAISFGSPSLTHQNNGIGNTSTTTRQHQSFSARRLAGAHTLRLQLVATSWLAFNLRAIFSPSLSLPLPLLLCQDFSYNSNNNIRKNEQI